ncbi:MAG: DUF2269 family protein [Hyphomicrobiales bacterium]
MNAKTILLFFHVAGAVVLMGELLFASLWLKAALKKTGGSTLLRYTLATMTWTSKSYALPAILVNLLAGLGLLHFAGVAWGTAIWLWISLVLYVVVTGMWHGMLIPMRKRMLAAVEAAAGSGGDGAAPAETLAMASKWVSASGVVMAMLFAILLLMTWKPTI